MRIGSEPVLGSSKKNFSDTRACSASPRDLRLDWRVGMFSDSCHPSSTH
jgi:hypothetical protein